MEDRNTKKYPPKIRKLWGPGPWQKEPDWVQWTDERTKYRCLIARSESIGTLCGYVGLKAEHPCHGIERGNFPTISSHGNITSAGLGDDGLWWIGCDCAHARDLVPGHNELFSKLLALATSSGNKRLQKMIRRVAKPRYQFKQTYRNLEYVTKVVLAMAIDLRRLETASSN